MRLIKRADWNARAPRRIQPVSSPRGVKVHYTGAWEDPDMARDHALCLERVRGIQNAHMNDNGWSDIGYNALVCWHGRVIAGRGPRVLCAANGPGLNAAHYAVCALVGNKGLAEPSAAMLNGLRDAIGWLRRSGRAGTQLAGHRDGYPTDCPGPRLYRWVRQGAPRPEEDDDVPDYVSVSATTETELPPGRWHTVHWDREYSDRGGQHPDKGGPALLSGPARYSLAASLRLTGLPEGARVQVRALESATGGGKGSTGPLQEFTGTSGDTHLLYALPADTVDDGHSLRVQVQHLSSGPAMLAAGTAKVLYWR